MSVLQLVVLVLVLVLVLLYLEGLEGLAEGCPVG